MARRGIGLVYGGGRLGLMGVVADAVIDGGGEAYGVIPQALIDLEVAHTGLTELHIVDTMHERKAMMTELTDAFVAIPGGIGTLDELFEAWSWNALGYHAKPFALLNVNGFWDAMIGFLDHVAGERLHVAGAARAIAGRGRRSARPSTGSTRRSGRPSRKWSGNSAPPRRWCGNDQEECAGGSRHEISDRHRRHRADPRRRCALLLEPALDPPPRRRRRLRAPGGDRAAGARHQWRPICDRRRCRPASPTCSAMPRPAPISSSARSPARRWAQNSFAIAALPVIIFFA